MIARPSPRSRTPVFDSYWTFAAERQAMYLRRLAGGPPPWTSDAVLSSWRFTNAFRAADRVSQYLMREVIYQGSSEPDEIIFRILLFKWFNKVSTWECLQRELGELRLSTFDPAKAEEVLTRERKNGRTIYSAAYIVPPLRDIDGPKHAGHLRQIVHMLESGLSDEVTRSTSLEALYWALRSWPGLGDFLAYQFAIDINYSPVVDHDENEFVVAGPGARDGISKVWEAADQRSATEYIREMVDQQDDHFARLGLRFPGLFGRPLKLIDCQNLFCEISKYSRVAHPDVSGIAGRTRIKQSFEASSQSKTLPVPFFPPKWGLSPGT